MSNGRYAVATFEKRTLEILNGSPITNLGELCMWCADRPVRGQLFCQDHLNARAAKGSEMERR